MNGPTWRQVRQLMRALADPAGRHSSTCGLLSHRHVWPTRQRSSRLLVTDLDWKAKTLDVSRSKRGGFQRFPLHRDVADSVLRYITKVRPAAHALSFS